MPRFDLEVEATSGLDLVHIHKDPSVTTVHEDASGYGFEIRLIACRNDGEVLFKLQTGRKEMRLVVKLIVRPNDDKERFDANSHTQAHDLQFQ